MTSLGFVLKHSVAALTITGALAGCSSGHFAELPAASPTASLSSSNPDILSQSEASISRLHEIAIASEKLADKNGITAKFYVHSNIETPPFVGKGDLGWVVVQPAGGGSPVARYPQNPTYRSSQESARIAQLAIAATSDFDAATTTVTEANGVFTFVTRTELQDGSYDSQVQVFTTREGLLMSVLIQDFLDNPTFTNFYEIVAYNDSNPDAVQVLKTNN